jgi:HD-like signal output (HDOD) protein
MSSTRERTLAKIQQGMQDGVCACLPELLRMIHTLSAKVPELAVQELADLIKNDTVVLERVIHAANSVGYNPTGVPISSVGEAIQIIGFDRVRSLSMALILLENSHAWQYREERR